MKNKKKNKELLKDQVEICPATERKTMKQLHQEIAGSKKTERVAQGALEFAESMINTVREPLISLDQDLRVVSVSRSFYEFFKVKPEETVGQLIYDLGNKQWNIPKLRELLETILPQKTTFDNYEVEHDFVDETFTLFLTAIDVEDTGFDNLDEILVLGFDGDIK